MVQVLTAMVATASRFAASGFARGFLRTLFGELGDKTFFVALVLTAWCPWEGPRDSAGQRLVVFLSTWIAVSAHAVLAASIRASEWSSWSDRGNFFLETAAGCLFAIISFRAYLGVTRSAATAIAGAGPAETEPLLAKPEVQYNRDAFAYSPFAMGGGGMGGGGGVAEDGGESAELEPSRSKSIVGDAGGWSIAALVGLLATSTCAFLAETEDKSWYALVDGGRQGTDLVLGAVLGFVPGLTLAVLLGFVLWWQLDAAAIRLVAMLAFVALSLTSFSQALLHLDAVDIGLTKPVGLLSASHL